MEGAFAYGWGSVAQVRLAQALPDPVILCVCLLVHSWVPTSFVGPLLQCSSRFLCSWTVFLYNMVLWVSAVQALSAYCRRHDALEPSGTDPREERDLGLLKRPAHSRCRGIDPLDINQANMVTREGPGLQADQHPTRLAMTVISWGAIVLNRAHRANAEP